MGILSWIIFGLIAGILAKWIMPGKDGGGSARCLALVKSMASILAASWLPLLARLSCCLSTERLKVNA